MRLSSDRKNRRRLLNQNSLTDLRLSMSAVTSENPVLYSGCCGKNASFEGKPKSFSQLEKVYTPNPEVVEVAFNYEPKLSGQDILGMNVLGSLSEKSGTTYQTKIHDRQRIVEEQQRIVEEQSEVGVTHPHNDFDEEPFSPDKLRRWQL